MVDKQVDSIKGATKQPSEMEKSKIEHKGCNETK